MTIDPYSPCPGGTGKKIKFCCPDILSDLDKVQKMLEGEQRAACLEHIVALEAKCPDRACLLTIKSMLQMQLGESTEAAATLANYREKYPENPVALAESASLVIAEKGGIAGIEPLQQALAACEREMPGQVYSALGLVATTLLSEGHIVAAHGHLMMQLGLSGGKDERTMQLIARLNESSGIPLLMKQDLPLVESPDGVSWKADFDAALGDAWRGAWHIAADRFTALAAQVGDQPAIWRNIATLRAWLAETPAAVAALRKYAALDVPLDDAVESEAFAQLLDLETIGDLLDLVTIEYPVRDMDALQAKIAGNQRFVRIAVDLAQLGNEGEPPPRAAFWVLDRPVPASGQGLTRTSIPLMIGQVFLYGKQTDRAARLELMAYRNDELQKSQEAVAEIAGDTLEASLLERVANNIPVLQHALRWNGHLPPDTPESLRRQLLAEDLRDRIFHRWPKITQRALSGKSAAEAASDPTLRIPTLAAILLLEQSGGQEAAIDFNELRRQLGLPTSDTIDPSTISAETLPLVRLARLDVPKLSDNELIVAYARADHYHCVAALRKLALEVTRRPSLEKQIDRGEAFGLLAQLEPDQNQALAYLEQSRTAARAAGRSCAATDLAELGLRIARSEFDDFDRLLHHIRDEHMREPGVSQALFQLLAEAGVINPDGSPRGQAAAPAGSGIVLPGGEPAVANKIWTPGGDAPAAGKKSAIWTPGD